MIYPIVAYGDPVLKKRAKDIPQDGSVDVQKLSEDMFETMYTANGVGLAGPQIGLNFRIFVVDTGPMEDEEGQEVEGLKQVFINAEMIEETGDEWPFEEGCLSIPGIRENVHRPAHIKIRFYDEAWNEHEMEFNDVEARVIQHEYDHIEGVLFTDHLSPLKKRLLKGKLANISKGKVKHDYRMKFPSRK